MKALTKTPLPILIAIFLVSVLLRVPNLNRPLSKHHEFCTAVALNVMLVWHQDGILDKHFAPALNFTGKPNKNINNFASPTGGIKDDKGNFYYISHPPFAYYLPYAVFKLIGQKPTVLGLQIMHVVVHFICALFVYFTVCLLGMQRPFGEVYVSGLIAFAVYTFLPVTMWFQSNVYMSDMLVHLWFILAVYTFLKLTIRKRFFSVKYLVYYCVFLFLMIYTSWLGVFFAFAVLLYSLIKMRFDKVFMPLFASTFVVSFVAVVLIVWQYSLINGLDELIIQLVQRYQIRGSAGGHGFFGFFKVKFIELLTVLKNYVFNYLPALVLIAALFPLMLSKRKLKFVFSKNGYRFLWLSTFPIIFMHLALLNYSGHDFTTLYLSYFVSCLIGIFYDKFKQTRAVKNVYLNGAIVFCCVASVAMYYVINKPGPYSIKGHKYATSMQLGLQIKNQVQPNQVVFYTGHHFNPMVELYAERNIKRITNETDALNFLKQNGLQQGIWFTQSSINSETLTHRQIGL